MSSEIRLRLPATSANLGAAFDTAAIALGFYLEIQAETADEFSISATGRNADICSKLENNLILDTYRSVLDRAGSTVVPIAVTMQNQIPLGMGCGSSAAGRLAGIAMAVHFGKLGWTSTQILEDACALEGHPDNAAACWLGGLVVAASGGRSVHAARVVPPTEWLAMVVLPRDPLPTSKARAVLPDFYSRVDTVANIQAASLLALAFAQGRGDLLRAAVSDRIHQPYRAEICPLLPVLLPLAGANGILAVALSGAGPAMLLILECKSAIEPATAAVLGAVQSSFEVEILITEFETSGACGVG